MVGVGEAGDPVAGGVEQDRVAGLGGFDAEADGEVGLADPGWSEQDHVLGFGDEGAGRQVREHVAAQRGQVVEVEVLEGFHRREVRGADPHRGAVGLAVGDLALQHRGQVLLVRPVLVAGLVGEFFPDTRRSSGSSTPGSGRPSSTASRPGRAAWPVVWSWWSWSRVARFRSAAGLVGVGSKSTPNRAS